MVGATLLAISSLASLAAQGGSQLAQKQQQKKAEETALGQQFKDTMINNMANYNNAKPMYQFNMGGMVPQAVPITVEGQEVINTPSGNPTKVMGPSHEQGGVDMTVPEGTQVFSNDLKNPDTGNSFAQDADAIKKQIEKQKSKKGGTSIDNNTRDLTIKNLQAQLDSLFDKQQQLNGNNQGQYGEFGVEAKYQLPTYDFGMNLFSNPYGATKNPYTGKYYSNNQLIPSNINIPSSNINIPLTKQAGLQKSQGLYTPGVKTLFNTAAAPSIAEPVDVVKQPSGFSMPNISGNILPWVNAAATLGGTIYNLSQGLDKQRTAPVYNPYEGAALAAMKDRSYNVYPNLSANRASQAVANRNITNAANSAGALMGNLTAAQNARMAADAQVYAAEQNANNTYLGEYAQMLYNAGQNRQQMDWQTNEANEQNRAARMQHFGQAFSDLGEYAQTQALMRSQANADEQRLGIYKDLYGSLMKYMPNMANMEINKTTLFKKGGLVKKNC